MLNDISSSLSNNNSSSSNGAWGSSRRPSLALFLSGYEHHAALGVNWVMFGSSGLQQRPPAGPLASYNACVPQQVGENTHVKVRLAGQENSSCVSAGSACVHVSSASPSPTQACVLSLRDVRRA